MPQSTQERRSRMSEANKSLVRRLIEEPINKGNFKVMDEILSTDYVYREPTAGEKRGSAGYQEIVTMYRNAFPDIKLTIEQQVAVGDKVVTRTSGSGTHRGGTVRYSTTGLRLRRGGALKSRMSWFPSEFFALERGLFDGRPVTSKRRTR